MWLVVCSMFYVVIVLLSIIHSGDWVASWGVFNYLFDVLELGCTISFCSVMCLLMLLFCGVLSVLFCDHYFFGRTALWYLIIIFLFVMCCLVLSNSFLFSLLMWEYLGVVSYLLILYYSNSDSLRAGLITMLVSRIGDVGFFVLVGYGFISNNFTGWILCLCVVVIVLTKSASFPFVSWLLEAMRAPTPVSALVHSSTLVAAGMWFVCCYSWLFSGVEVASDIIVISCFITIFITGFCAVGFCDLKKLVALSTSNNIAWCLLFFFLGNPTLGLIQLLCHGVAKCGLFISVGDVMSSGGGSQNYTNFYSRKSLWELCSLFFIVFSLCGLPFLGVFFSKHLFFSAVSWYNIVFWVVCLFGLILSFCYSVRLFLLCVVGKSGYSLSFDNNFFFVVLNIPMFSVLNAFLGDLVVDWCESDLWISLCLLLCSIVGVFLGAVISYTHFSFNYAWFISLMGMDLCVYLFNCFYGWIRNIGLICHYRWDTTMVSYIFLKIGGVWSISFFITIFFVFLLLVVFSS